MKKIFLLSLLISGLAMGQDFFSDQAEESDQEFFNGSTSPDPDYGEDGENPGNPEDPPPKAPIDDWLFLLPIAGIVVGGYYLSIKYDVLVV